MPNPHNPTSPPNTNTTTTTTTMTELLSPPGGLAGASFDSNMVIILAALLCALICALGLNSVLRCALRCTRRTATTAAITSSSTSSRMDAATGLKEKELRQIRIAVVGATGEEISGSTECPICLTEFEEGEKVRVLPICNHGFHVRCIDIWLAKHSSCPNCRHSIISGGDDDDDDDDVDVDVDCEADADRVLHSGDAQSVVVLAVRVDT